MSKLDASKVHVQLQQKCLSNTTKAVNAMVNQHQKKTNIVGHRYKVGDGVTVKVPKTGKAGAKQGRLFGVVVQQTKSGLNYRVRTAHGVSKNTLDYGELEKYRGALSIPVDGWQNETITIKKAAVMQGENFRID